MLGFAVQNSHLVAGGEQPLDEKFADEQRPADYENAHAICRLVTPFDCSLARSSVVIFQAEVCDQIVRPSSSAACFSAS